MDDTTAHREVTEHLRALHEPAFGRPHGLREPHVTRDGERVAVTGSVLDDLTGPVRTALYTAEDGELRAVSAGPGSARWARFSPDGDGLAFLSDRHEAGVFQLHLLSSGLGEASPAPEVPGSVEYAQWSPDGRRILLGVAGPGADLSGGQGSGSARRTEQDRPSWFPEVEDGGVDEAAWRTLWIYTLATGGLTRLSPDGLNCWEAGWCGPDRVVTISSGEPGEDAWYAAHLTLLDLAGEARKLLDSLVQLALPAGSPDGARVAVVEAACSDRGVVAGDLLLVDPDTGAVRRIDTAGTDVSQVEWLDADRLGYFGQRRLASVAGILDVPGGSVREVLDTELSCGGGTFYPAGAFTADGRVLTVQDSYTVAPRLVLTGESGDRVLASTAHPGTDHLLTVAGGAETVTWTAPDGLDIDGILCRPAGEGPFPLVVNIHGGPIWAFRNSWSMRYPWVPLLVARGYAVLNPNPRGSGGRGQEFAARVIGDMGGADAHDLLSGIDALVGRGLADEDRIGLIGGSYGGFMSSWLVTQDRRFVAAVPISPVTDWYSQSFTSNIGSWGTSYLDADPEDPGTLVHTRSPVLHASKARTPCLNVAGALDRATPPGQAREFHQALRAHGVPSALVIYPEEGHGVRAFPAQIDLLTRILRWFDHYLR
ncbi:S9 family peptidase [Amycolatopsis oliviviridis]|uniref:Peptidase n=1 Tax=Amycolatopsis oliviviridis TaxID=1471590 RepID=A0ABQ3LBH0_9PSEU|nr:S9 family peptidase [Amycolatopsis oliviviridis]GHH00715.1 peptidase [Amycolatopsis oliviviridis]